MKLGLGLSRGDFSKNRALNGVQPAIYADFARGEYTGGSFGSLLSNSGGSLGPNGWVMSGSNALAIPAATFASLLGGSMPSSLCVVMSGFITFSDNDTTNEAEFYKSVVDSSNRLVARLNTNSANTGRLTLFQVEGGDYDEVNSASDAFAPGTDVPFVVATRHGETFINAGTGNGTTGTVLTADETPTALADVTGVDFEIFPTLPSGGSVTISEIRIFADDIGDAGLAEAVGA